MVDLVFWISLATVVSLIVFLGRYGYQDWKRRDKRRRDREAEEARQASARKLQDEINARFEQTRARLAEKAQKAAEDAEQSKRDLVDRLQRAGVVSLVQPPGAFGNRRERRAKKATDRRKGR